MTTTSENDKQVLLKVARESIAHGLRTGRALPVEARNFSAALGAIRATFVTLQYQGRLRGCIGTLAAQRPLIVDVAENAFSAAFRDPRFSPLTQMEFAGYPPVEIHISILSESQPMSVRDEADLLSQLRPGVDGLIFSVLSPQDGGSEQNFSHRSTFLPAVWQSLPEPKQFIEQLKAKAGLPRDFWSDRVRLRRYTVEEFH